VKNIKSKVFLVTIGLILSTTLSAMPANATGTIVDTTIDANPGVANYGYFNAPMGTQLGFTFQTGTKDVGGAIDIFTEYSKTIQFHLDFTTGDPTSTYITDSPGPFEYRIEIGVDQSTTQINMTIDGATPLATRPTGFPEPPRQKSSVKPTVKSSAKPRVKTSAKPTVKPSADPSAKVKPTVIKIPNLVTTPYLAMVKNSKNLTIIRDGTSAQIQLFYKPGDISYTIYTGQHVDGLDRQTLANLMQDKSKNILKLGDRTGQIDAGFLVYDPKKVIDITSDDISKKWAFFKNTQIDNNINYIVVVTKNSNGIANTFDFRVTQSRDGSVWGRLAKATCDVSSYGLPIAEGTLDIANLSLDAASHVPGIGGKVASLGSTLIDEITIATKNDKNLSDVKDMAKAARKSVKTSVAIQVEVDKFNANGVKLNGAISIPVEPKDLKGKILSKLKLDGIVSKIENNVIVRKGIRYQEVIVEVTTDVNSAIDLYQTLTTGSAQINANLNACKALN